MPRPPRPKYQVFISSTFKDLREEREAVTWAIMKARHIPAGMEAFPATADRGWKIIQREIDVTDYYVLILAGRYGSPDPELDGLSWTEREYDYAVSKGIKVLAFIRSEAAITVDKIDPKTEERRQKFIEKVRGAHLCKGWSQKEDLVSEVTHALRNQIDDDRDEEELPPGWWRESTPTSPAIAEEMARLSSENERLRSENARLKEGNEGKPVIRILDRKKNILESGSEFPVRLGRGHESPGYVSYHFIHLENTGTVQCKHLVLHITASDAPVCDVDSHSYKMFVQEKTRQGIGHYVRATVLDVLPGEILEALKIRISYPQHYMPKAYTIDLRITGSHGVVLHENVTFVPSPPQR